MGTAPTSDADVDVVVIGGGLGGLAAAAFLRRVGRRVRVYEQAPEVRCAGGGIVLAPNAARLIRRLGVMDAVERDAVVLQAGWEFRRWSDGTVLFSQPMGALFRRLYDEDTLAMHYADLREALLSTIDPDWLVLGRRCTGVEQRADGVVVSFDDGTTVTGAAVIGADGMHSAVARAVVRAPEPVYSGLCAYRCLVPAEAAPAFARRPVQSLWLGPGRHLVHYPISAGNLINVVAVVPEPELRIESRTAHGGVADLVAEFATWDPRLARLIEAAPGVARSVLCEREPLPRWVEGSVALLGDAAHPMSPYLAQDAAQVIEDAAALARCVANHGDDLRAALRAYQDVRIGRAAEVLRRSRGRLDSNHLPDGPEQRARDDRFANQDPLRYNDWLYGHDAEHAAAGR